MKEVIQNLIKEKSKLNDRHTVVYNAISNLKTAFPNVVPSCVEETLNLLNEEDMTIRNSLKGFQNAIEAFQNVCPHTHDDVKDAMVYSGHDSHNSYYECRICGCEFKN